MLADTRSPRLPIHDQRLPADRLREALLELARGRATIVSHAERRWASVTFIGARHRLELRFDGAEAVAAGELFVACLPDHEFTILGQLVADATVTAVDHRLDPPLMQVACELLLLDEA